MTVHVEFFCDRCNPSQQRRDPGDEVSTGYAKSSTHHLPARWVIHPTANGGIPGEVCDACVLKEADAEASEGPGPRPSVPAAAHGPASGAWPALSSPFGGEGG